MKRRYIILSMIILVGCSEIATDHLSAPDIEGETPSLESLLSTQKAYSEDIISNSVIPEGLNFFQRGNTIAKGNMIITGRQRHKFNPLIEVLDNNAQQKSQYEEFTVWTINGNQLWFYPHPVEGFVIEFR
jgi:hypothetical protein